MCTCHKVQLAPVLQPHLKSLSVTELGCLSLMWEKYEDLWFCYLVCFIASNVGIMLKDRVV